MKTSATPVLSVVSSYNLARVVLLISVPPAATFTPKSKFSIPPLRAMTGFK